MKRFLLLLTFLIGTALSLLAATESSYSITFKNGSTDNNTAANTSSFILDDNIESGKEYIKIVTTCTRIFPHSTNGLKFGTKKATDGNGELTFTVSDAVKDFKVTRIVLTCTKFGSDSGKLKLNGFSETKSPTTEESDLEWVYETPTAISEIAISTTSKRAYVRKITVYYEKEVQSLGEVSASINGTPLTITNGELEVTVPAMNGAEKSTLTVSCPNAEKIALGNGETKNADTYTLPIAFETDGTVIYSFTISNSLGEKKLDVYIYELGVPALLKSDGTPFDKNSPIVVDPAKSYTVTAANAESITVAKDGGTPTTVSNNSITFSEPGVYVFTATAGAFSTTSTYTVSIANKKTPSFPVVTLKGDAPEQLNNNTTRENVLLNSTLHISCENATTIYVDGADIDIITSSEGDFTISKSGTYTIYGENEYASEGSKESERFTLTINNLTLGNPQIKVASQETAVTDFTTPIALVNGGEDITLMASDAKGPVSVTSFTYKIGNGEVQTVTGNTKKITDFSDPYTFVAKYKKDASAEEASTTEFTVTFTKAEVFVRATNVNELKGGDKVIMVCEETNQAAGKTGSPVNTINITNLTNGKWINNNLDVAVFTLEAVEGATNQYKFNVDGQYLYAGKNLSTSRESTGYEPASELDNDNYFDISFDGNKVIISSLITETRELRFYQNTSDVNDHSVGNYDKTKTFSSVHNIQLYVIQKAPEAPTLTVKGEAVTDVTKQIEVKVGDEAVFSSKYATSMVVNDADYSADNGSYTITFAESMFTNNNEYTVRVKGKNETGESDEVSVTFNLKPNAPVVTVKGETVQGDAVTVLPGDVMTITAPEGTKVVYKKGDGAETECETNTFNYTFSPEDYILADGKVSATPVTYTFKAKKGENESDVVTLNVTVQEPAVADGSIYRLVTSTAEIQEGKKYVIACHGPYAADNNPVNVVMGNSVQEKYRVPIKLELNQDETLTPNDQTLILSFEKVEGQENQWYIKTDNYAANLGNTYYFQGYSTKYLYLTTEKSSAYKYTIEFEKNNVKLTSGGYTIMSNNTKGTERFTQYPTKDYGTAVAKSPVQLYVFDEVQVQTYDEFVNVSTLHPGREVKFVKPLTIKANYGNELWMVDETGKAVYAKYDEADFTDYLMDALNRFNRKFWNFSGVAVKDPDVKDEALMYVNITSIDVAYELSTDNGDPRTGKAPYTEDMEDLKDPSMTVPLFDYDDLVWWSFGQIYGNIVTDSNGNTTIKQLSPEGTEQGNPIPVLTDLPPAGPTEPNNSSAISYLRYETLDIKWLAGSDDGYFSPNSNHGNQYIVGAIMPDASGKKAIAAMAVSGKQISTGVESVDADDAEAIVDVYNMQGMRLRSGVRRADALRDLPAGIYIVGGKKVLVTQ